MNKVYLLRNSNLNKLKLSYKAFCKNNKNDYQVFILTTAITRPSLHSISFKNYKEFLSKSIKIKWIINIDFIKFNEDSSPDKDLEETKNNIIEIFKDYDNITFEFKLNEKGNFNRAVRNITDILSNQISLNCKAIFYLEDDWFCLKPTDILNKYLSEKHEILKLYYDNDPNMKISFQPAIVKPYIWYYMFYQKLKKSNHTNIDPEKICSVRSEEIQNYNLTYKVFNVFKDIGRDVELMDNDNLIRGWFQLMNTHTQENLSLTYIYKDRLIYSTIFIISRSNKSLECNKLYTEISNYLNTFFRGELRNQVLDNFSKYKDRNYKYYKKCCDYKNKINDLSLTNIYNQIDKLIEIGA
jgi:hypothetical protein